MGIRSTTKRLATETLGVERRGGSFVAGRWVDAATATTFEARANVQPAPSEAIARLPEGSRKDGAIVIFLSDVSIDLQTVENPTVNADIVTRQFTGARFEVAMVDIWPRHRRYTATRFGQ